MSKFMIRTIVLFAVMLPGAAVAHGSPSQWSAEGTEYGCWITRWLVGDAAGGGGEAVASVQVVLGRIVPPRAGSEQPGLSKAELEGATTLNVRLVDPSLAGADSVSVVRGDQVLKLGKRELEGELGDFPSFYLTGAEADSVLASLRASQLTAIAVRRADGSEARFTGGEEGLRVAIAMYDACIAAK